MSFGQPSGPPAPANKVRELLALLQEAGHTDFRDARGPMGFTQRQAGGKFTRDEVDAFIERLEAEATAPDDARPDPAMTAGASSETMASAPVARPAPPVAGSGSLRGVTSEDLAAELQRRGWIVAEP